MQIVFVGDFFQLPPVSRNGEPEYAFEHRIWKTLHLTPCVLTTQFRQNNEDDLSIILDEIRGGGVSENSRQILRSRDLPVLTDDHTELFTKNIAVDTYNSDKLSKLSSEPHTYEMSGSGAEKFILALKK